MLGIIAVARRGSSNGSTIPRFLLDGFVIDGSSGSSVGSGSRYRYGYRLTWGAVILLSLFLGN